MGARPSSFRGGGGGYLHGLVGVITGYEFEVGETAPMKKGARKGEDFTPLSLVPAFRADGADEDQTIRLLIGDASDFGGVSDDGQTLYTPEGQAFSGICDAATFINSLCRNGFPDTLLSEDPTEINYAPIIGTRVELAKVENPKKKKQLGKDGKTLYPAKDLQVAQVLALPGAKTNGAKVAAKPNGKAVKATAGLDIPSFAAQTVKDVVEEKGGSLSLKALRMAVLMKITPKHPEREAVLAWAGNPTNLEGIDGIEFDGSTLASVN